jgi:uncharacterized protein YijF (DUF1287 family)
MKYLVKFFLTIIIISIIVIPIYTFLGGENVKIIDQNKKYIPKNPIENSAYKQIGIVTDYDRSNGYYEGGDPPKYTGVCTDTVVRALLENGYNLQKKVFQDIKNFPKRYNDSPDKNINHRRVKNLLVFFENSKDFISLPKEINNKTIETWQAGDIITYKKIPGRLWHIGIISGLKSIKGVPMLIDNHGYGTNIRIEINSWPSAISGHFRLIKKEDMQ